VASASHALTVGFVSLVLARTALGFGEGATFPGGLRTVVQTLPPGQQARGVAVAYSGGSLGAVVTPLLMTPVFAAFGWRGAFWFTGAIGLAWVLLWLGLSRRPELRHKPEVSHADTRANWRDRRFWAFVFIYAFGALPLGFVLYFAPLYLKVLGKTQMELGGLLWIPPLGWEVGYFVWGWFTDKYAGRFGYQTLLGILTLLSLPLAAAPMAPHLPALMALLFLAMFVASGFIIGGVSFATAAFGRRDSAFLAGLGAGSWSALVAVVMPVAGRLFDLEMYQAAFVFAALFPLVGFAAQRACYSK